jgi:uncharacterized protein (TIRG00374 family)
VSTKSTRGRLASDVKALTTARKQATDRRRSALRWVLSLGSMLAIFGYIFWDQVPIEIVAREILNANPWWLLVAIIVTVLHRVLMALKWWVILRGEGARLGVFYLTMVTFVGYFVGFLVPGALGIEVVRVWYLSRDHAAGNLGLASALIDRATSMASLAALALGGLLVFDVQIPGRTVIIAACLLVLALFVLATLVSPWLSRWLAALAPLAGASWLARLRLKMHHLVLTLSNMQGRVSVVLQSLGIGIAAQIVRGIIVYIVFVALGRYDLFAVSLVLAPIVMFVAMVPLGINSTAVAAGATLFFLEPLGVSPETSVSSVMLLGILAFVMIPIGALCFAASGYWRTGPGAQNVAEPSNVSPVTPDA